MTGFTESYRLVDLIVFADVDKQDLVPFEEPEDDPAIVRHHERL